MAAQQETFKGFEIVIDAENNLRIGDQSIDVHRSDDGKFYTPYLPYTQYDSILELAKQVVDKAPDFDTLARGN